jgi:hypothetical protein
MIGDWVDMLFRGEFKRLFKSILAFGCLIIIGFLSMVTVMSWYYTR